MNKPELAEHPERWCWITLDQILESIEAGKSFKCDERPPQDGEVGVIKVSAVTWGEFDASESKTCMDPDRIDPRFFIQPGDFLFSRANTIDLVGACVIVRSVSRRLMLSDKILRFRFAGVEPKWVLYALRSKHGRREIERLATGNQESMRNIGQDRIRQIRIPLAPLSEQKRIVAEIDKQFTRLDAGVEALKRVQAQLKRYRASVLKAACEGRLVPTEAERARREKRDYEPADQVLARNKMEIAVLGTESVPLPEGWCWTTIARTIEIIDYRGRTPPYSEAGIPHLRSSNVRDGRVVWENLRFVTQATYDQYMTRGIPRVGDLLFSTEAPLGELAPVPDAPFSLAQRLMVLRPDQRVWNAAFLMYQMMSPSFRARLTQQGTGSTVTGVSSRNFQPLPLAVPPLAEQRRIVSEVEERLSATSAAASMIDASLRRAGSLRYAVLKAAFEGSLVPQDPRDEPASKLLERISAAAENKPLPKQGRAKQTTAVPKMKATR